MCTTLAQRGVCSWCIGARSPARIAWAKICDNKLMSGTFLSAQCCQVWRVCSWFFTPSAELRLHLKQELSAYNITYCSPGGLCHNYSLKTPQQTVLSNINPWSPAACQGRVLNWDHLVVRFNTFSVMTWRQRVTSSRYWVFLWALLALVRAVNDCELLRDCRIMSFLVKTVINSQSSENWLYKVLHALLGKRGIFYRNPLFSKYQVSHKLI